MKIIKRSLIVLSVLINLLLGWIFFVQSTDNSIRIKLGPNKTMFDYEATFFSMSGMLVGQNYKAYYTHMLYGMQCVRTNKSQAICMTQDNTIDNGYILQPTQEIWNVEEWSKTRIIASNDYSCRKSYWIIDIASKNAVMESKWKDPKDQRGDCSIGDTDTRKSVLADWSAAVEAKNRK